MNAPQQHGPGGVAIGVDTGGTHTDLVLARDGAVVTLKVPSTPDDLSIGIVGGLTQLLGKAGLETGDVERFVYASTLVTNLIVEEAEASVGLITTEGFRDILEIGRASRKPDVYDIHWRPSLPLVPRHLRLGVGGRIDPSGRELDPLDEAGVRAALSSLAGAGVSSIAVCFLHSYANPAHERRVAELAAEVCPEIDVTLSSDVAREFREYERVSTTSINAFIKRPMTEHLKTLAKTLHAEGMDAPALIMQGNGGVATFDAASRLPVSLTHSGPTGGIVGANALAAKAGIDNIITLDMGGTSADVALIADGEPVLTSRGSIGTHPLLVPMLELVTIGAGGGSIAAVEGGSGLRVGPRSAGSVPGPACYGQGGEAPTVCDANLAAGRLNPDFFLAGMRRLRPDLARKAIETRIAEPLGLTLDEAALGILAVAEAHMVNAIRLVSVDKGLDPSGFTLVGFGGAGPLHAVRLAEALNIERILIPPAPGNLSAMGLLSADLRHDFVRTLIADAHSLTPDALGETFTEMLGEAQSALARDGIDANARTCALSVDLRYRGQNHELNLPVPMAVLGGADLDQLAADFHRRHETVYGYHLADRRVQIVNLRVTAFGQMPKAAWPVHPPRAGGVEPVSTRRVSIASDDARPLPVYRLTDAFPEAEIAGPAIVEYAGSTLFLGPDWQARFDEGLNAHLTRLSSRAGN